MPKKTLKIPRKHIIFFILIIYIACLIVPYISHKEPSDSFKKSFKNRSFYSTSSGTERIAYIDDNTDALEYRLRMMEEAEEEIILSTFDFNSDRAGRDVMAALLHAAGRGVHVKVIVDGISGFLDMTADPWFQALASSENIEIKVYNPINLLKPWNLQARLHDKYVIVDNQMFLLGGRNTMNLFLGNYSKARNLDQELFVYETADNSDSSLYQLKSYFQEIWNLPDSKDYHCQISTKKISEHVQKLESRYEKLKDLYPEAFTPWDWTEKTMVTNKVSLLYNPIETENKEPWMWYSIHQLMTQGQDITLYTPYIICGKEMYADITSLTEDNIGVEIITNDVAKGANPFGCTDYLNQKENIRATGARVYEYMAPHSSHTKTVLIDDRMSIIGSYNLDMRSTYQDTELMLAVDCTELNDMLRQKAEKDKTYSKIINDDGTYTYGENYKPKELTVGKKIFYAVLRILVIPFRRFL